MGTPLYTGTLYTLYTDEIQQTRCLREVTHQTYEAKCRPGHSGGSKEGREAVQAGGSQEVVGIHQGEEAAGPREQAVLQARQDHGAYIWQGEGPGIWNGKAPEGSPDRLTHWPRGTKFY